MTKLKLTIYLTIAIVIGIVIGVFVGAAWMSIVSERIDREYFTALRTIGGSGINWIDGIFRYCVVLLVNTAKLIGISYEELNIWVFIVIQPLIIFLLFIWVILLRRKIKSL